MFCVVVYLSSNIVAMPSLYSAYFIITNLFDIPIELSNSIKKWLLSKELYFICYLIQFVNNILYLKIEVTVLEVLLATGKDQDRIICCIHHGGAARIEGIHDQHHLGPQILSQDSGMRRSTYRGHVHKLNTCERSDLHGLCKIR